MADEIKRLAVLGCTGSIGRQTLGVVRALPGRFKVTGLAGGNNTALLQEQVAEFKPKFVYYLQGRGNPSFEGCQFLQTEEMASHPDVDMVVSATPGSSGLEPTIAAIRAGKDVALANKESLVTAGKIVMGEAKVSGSRILPVDSEHSAIWQCLAGEDTPPSHIILTASGGPFRGYTSKQLGNVTAGQALKHPSWQMGEKVTIDSASLLNKGLEIIEAHWLFNVPIDDISVLVHPQSIIHSIVEFADGSAKAQMGCPDMRLPIQYALTSPQRLSNPTLPKLDWQNIKQLDFEPPNTDNFPCLRLAIEAGKKGGTYPAVLCAVDEIAVGLFLTNQINFPDIGGLIEHVMQRHVQLFNANPTIADINIADAWARDTAIRLTLGG